MLSSQDEISLSYVAATYWTIEAAEIPRDTEMDE